MSQESRSPLLEAETKLNDALKALETALEARADSGKGDGASQLDKQEMLGQISSIEEELVDAIGIIENALGSASAAQDASAAAGAKAAPKAKAKAAPQTTANAEPQSEADATPQEAAVSDASAEQVQKDDGPTMDANADDARASGQDDHTDANATMPSDGVPSDGSPTGGASNDGAPSDGSPTGSALNDGAPEASEAMDAPPTQGEIGLNLPAATRMPHEPAINSQHHLEWHQLQDRLHGWRGSAYRASCRRYRGSDSGTGQQGRQTRRQQTACHGGVDHRRQGEGGRCCAGG